MSQIYRTSQGDTVDWIAYKNYESPDPMFAVMILKANTGLADYGPVLPAGLSVVLPVYAPKPEDKPVVSLWS